MQFRFALSLLVSGILLALHLSGCGRDYDAEVEDSASRAGRSSTLNPPAMSAGQRQARQAQVSCANPQNCPNGVGMVVSALDDSTRVCTGFLVSEDTVATQGQCLPEPIRIAQADCRGQVRVLFPNTGLFPAEEVECLKVLSVSARGSASSFVAPDFVFLKLDRTLQRHSLRIDYSPMLDNQAVTIAKLDRAESLMPNGVISVRSCRVVHHSMALPLVNDGYAPVQTVSDCGIVDGNLGAPILNSDGVVLGLVQGTFRPASHNEFRESVRGIAVPEEANVAYVANLACVREPDANSTRTIPSACSNGFENEAVFSAWENIQVSNVVSRSRNDINRIYALWSASSAEFDTLFRHWNLTHSDRIRWKPYAEGTDTVIKVRPQPDCVNHPDRWIGEYSGFLGIGLSSHESLPISMPVWQIRLNLNSDLQLVREISPLPDVAATLSFDPSNIQFWQEDELPRFHGGHFVLDTVPTAQRPLETWFRHFIYNCP